MSDPRIYEDVCFGGRYGDKKVIIPKDMTDWSCAEMRMAAMVEVLRRIPEDAYKELLEKKEKDEFRWFIPSIIMFGSCEPFDITHKEETLDSGDRIPAHAEVVYLSPQLEYKERKFVIAVIAHELAHIRLEHIKKRLIYKIRPKKTNDIHVLEEEAWSMVEEWGFKEEYKEWKEAREMGSDCFRSTQNAKRRQGRSLAPMIIDE